MDPLVRSGEELIRVTRNLRDAQRAVGDLEASLKIARDIELETHRQYHEALNNHMAAVESRASVAA